MAVEKAGEVIPEVPDAVPVIRTLHPEITLDKGTEAAGV